MNTPEHYGQTIEPIAVIDSWGLDFRLGNVIKYIARYKQKNGIQDLKKAADYLNDKIRKMSESPVQFNGIEFYQGLDKVGDD